VSIGTNSQVEDSSEIESIRIGLRTSHALTAIILVTLLAALGVSAFRNADARDRETQYLLSVEDTASSILTTQRNTQQFIELYDDMIYGQVVPTTVKGLAANIKFQLINFDEKDAIASDVVSAEFDYAFTVLTSSVQGNFAYNPLSQNARAVVLRESRNWLADYQSSAVAKVRVLAEVRATNERNQAILLFLCLALSVWLLSWISFSVADAYRRSRMIISSERAKVESARTALQHATDQLSHQAKHDALTGLPNRTTLKEKISELLAIEPRVNVVVFFCDLDRFKIVNDSLGHVTGDEILAEAASRISKAVEPEDFVARFGGDEFVVVSTMVEDREAGLRIAERLTRALSKPFVTDEQEIQIGVSIGISTSNSDSNANQLLRNADIAMYRAKAQSTSNVKHFEELGDTFSRRLDTENALRKAISNNELLLHWQPIVNLKNSQVHTLEALVRWRRGEDVLLMPKDFMAIAEDSGLIVDLGRWVIREACAAGALTEDRSVSVNVSASQLRDVRFVEDLRDILAETALPPERLIIEVTEHTVIDPAIVNQPLKRVRELGCKIALDDFGTGYSSLGLLNQLPVDIVKLDRTFTQDLADSEPKQAIVKALVQLTNALNMMLVVEGVESDAQRKTLRSLGVLHGQGYWFGKPEPGRLAKFIGSRLNAN
jgi:diguanylate cyclase (GGDEF)-like protein